MTNLVRFFLFLILSKVAYCAIEVHIENPIDDDEEQEVHNLLKATLVKTANDKWTREAERELASLERYSSMRCTIASDVLRCNLKRYPIVRNILFSGVPILILERELQKHIPLRPGEVINADHPSFKDMVKRSENAIKSFLEKQGYFRAQIKTTFKPVSGVPAADLHFEIQSGSFLKVKKVTLNSEIPLDPELVLQPFREMCASVRFAFEGIFQRTKSCYNKDIEREKMSDIELSLTDYPEAHVSVERNIIEDKEGNAEHLELGVNVLLGTKLEYDFEFVDAQYLDISGFVGFFRYLFLVEFFSRALNIASSAQQIYPEDQTILSYELKEALTFKQSHIVDDSQIQASIANLLEVLRARGYANAVVEVASKERRKGNVMFVKFRIKPGSPAPLRSIRLIGSDLFTYEDIEDSRDLHLSTRSLLSSGHLTTTALDHDVAEIHAFFKKQGFEKVEVKAMVSQKSDGLELLYDVHPGPRRLVKRVIFKNDDKTLTQTYLKSWTDCKGPRVQSDAESTTVLCLAFPLVKSDLDNETLKLVTLYTQHGFLKATPQLVFEENNDEVSVVFDFSTALVKRSRVVEFLVDGNIATYRSVIERELGYKNVKPSAEFLPIALENGLRRLRSYSAFSKVMLEPIEKGNDPDLVYLFLQIVERPTLALDLDFTFDSDRLFGITLGLSESNFFGTLLKLETELKFGLFIGNESSFSNVLTWRRFLGVPMDVVFNVPTLLYEQFYKQKTTEISQRHAKFLASVGFDWLFLEHLRPSFELLLRVDQWQEGDFPAESFTSLDGLLEVAREPPSVRGVLKPSLTYIALDDLFDPKLGYKLRGGLEISPPAFTSSFPYTIFNLEGTGYASLGPVTLAANVHFRRGLIENPARNWWILREEGDFKLLGGVNGPRSYDREAIGLYGDYISGGKDVLVNGQPKKALHTGDFQFFASAELRFPLIAKLPLGKLDGAVFSDLGYVGICDTTFFCFGTEPGQPNPHQFGWSVGASLRWVLPVGPVSIDYAVSPIHASPGIFGRESRLTFQFGYMY